MNKAVIYARYSSDKQSEQSIEGQLRACYQFALDNNYIVVNTYIDRAVTGRNDDRVYFQAMLKNSIKMSSMLLLFIDLIGLQGIAMTLPSTRLYFARMESR